VLEETILRSPDQQKDQSILRSPDQQKDQSILRSPLQNCNDGTVMGDAFFFCPLEVKIF
jgi:hypothetical protein